MVILPWLPSDQLLLYLRDYIGVVRETKCSKSVTVVIHNVFIVLITSTTSNQLQLKKKVAGGKDERMGE